MTPDAEPTLTAAWPPPADRPPRRYAIGASGFGVGMWWLMVATIHLSKIVAMRHG